MSFDLPTNQKRVFLIWSAKRQVLSEPSAITFYLHNWKYWFWTLRYSQSMNSTNTVWSSVLSGFFLVAFRRVNRIVKVDASKVYGCPEFLSFDLSRDRVQLKWRNLTTRHQHTTTQSQHFLIMIHFIMMFQIIHILIQSSRIFKPSSWSFTV